MSSLQKPLKKPSRTLPYISGCKTEEQHARCCHLWGSGFEGEDTPHTAIVDEISVPFETREIVDQLRCIKASEVPEVVMYEYQGSERLQQRITENKKEELKENRQKTHKDNSEYYGRMRTFLEALGRAAKSLFGAKYSQEEQTGRMKRPKYITFLYDSIVVSARCTRVALKMAKTVTRPKASNNARED
ncbi:hypothetical protein EVAR_82732_1 [Eumeta japonica]|uniref:Uncharacterized protein n=1 Tax=Eumeta variegata TaxID=151549 RepID=A0A4C1ZHF5_EUMVA|nr:hypothetical protein EVAR_82732_1 [Eumeta japonica]